MSIKDNITIKFGVIGKEGFETWVSFVSLSRTAKISELVNAIRLALKEVNPPEKMNHISGLTQLYYQKSHRFLDLNKKLSKEGLRENDFLIITDCEDKEYLDMIISLKLRDHIGEMTPNEQSKTVLVIRGLIRGIPYIGHALEALICPPKK